MNKTTNSTEKNSPGRLLAMLTACFYVLFTLLPDSHSLMVAWPWVFIWQVGLLCPVFWLLLAIAHQQRFPFLRNGIDWVIGLIVLGYFITTIFAQFPHQSMWYSWAGLCFIASIYALNSWLDTPQRREQLLTFQGYVNYSFIVVSLILWLTQTLLPELSRLNSFTQYGINLSFNFSILQLRNWAPFGHQNYVAGYLILALPLLVALSMINQGKKRLFWLVGIGLGLIDLYTTSSRGGWGALGILCLCAIVVLIIRSNISRIWLILSIIGFIVLVIFQFWSNTRLRLLITRIFSGDAGGDLAYRIINNNIGWEMGLSHPLSGLGLGGVPLLYQKYRPIWAGRESELTYQLHSTPAQVWAEMGIIPLLAVISAIALLFLLFKKWLNQNTDHPKDEIILWCLYSGFIAYGFMSLTDYQLDNVAISGTLVIFITFIATIFNENNQEKKQNITTFSYAKGVSFGGLGIAIAIIIWLIPIHFAWQLSSHGFLALKQKEPDFEMFINKLTQANTIIDWEPYYPYQLGWNIGNLGLEKGDDQLITKSREWFEKAIAVSPAQEFGYSSLGWLLLREGKAKEATQNFIKSAQLIPAKRGIYYGLGLSLLEQNKVDLALESFTIEALRNPLFITSPIWQTHPLKPLYFQLTNNMLEKYTEFLQRDNNNTYWYQCRGGLLWWLGDLQAAHKDLEVYGTPLSKFLLEIATVNSRKEDISNLPSSAGKKVIMAWFNPEQRIQLLQQAWIEVNREPLPEMFQKQLVNSMENSATFEAWLKINAPVLQYRRQRSGFGVIQRHIDGSIPTDFWLVVENLPMIHFFPELLPSPVYEPELDLTLQPLREHLSHQLII